MGVRRDEWIFKHACDFAQEIFNKNGDLMPMFVGYNGEAGFIIPFIYPGKIWEEQERNKHQMLHLIKLVFLRHGVDHYVSMNEAWTLKAKSAEDRHKWKGSLEHHPDRTECLMVSSVTHKRNRIKMWEIQRDEKGHPTLVPQDEKDEPAKFSGRFMDLLPPEGVSTDYLLPKDRETVDDIIKMLGVDMVKLEDMPRDEGDSEGVSGVED